MPDVRHIFLLDVTFWCRRRVGNREIPPVLPTPPRSRRLSPSFCSLPNGLYVIWNDVQKHQLRARLYPCCNNYLQNLIFFPFCAQRNFFFSRARNRSVTGEHSVTTLPLASNGHWHPVVSKTMYISIYTLYIYTHLHLDVYLLFTSKKLKENAFYNFNFQKSFPSVHDKLHWTQYLPDVKCYKLSRDHVSISLNNWS